MFRRYIFFVAVLITKLPVLGQTTEPISVASDGTQGNFSSGNPSISADGRYVAFASNASNLVSGDTNGYSDVFVRDRQAGQITRVSLASDGTQSNEASGGTVGFDGNFWVGGIAISADGRYVAFESYASNLVPGDTNGYSDVFVHDCQTGQTTRVSVSSTGVQGNGSSFEPSISADGRYVAFSSGSTNLVPGGTFATNVFVHDCESGQTEQISIASDGTQPHSGGASLDPSISADGRFVAFFSQAYDLVPDYRYRTFDVYVRDRQNGQTTRVSVASDGTPTLYPFSISDHPSISADGRHVAFSSNTAFDLVQAINNEGQTDVFVHDRQTGQTTRVSIATDGTRGNGPSGFGNNGFGRGAYGLDISSDGRFVTFVSDASNLVFADTNEARDVFVHDRETGQTTRVSVASDGVQGNSFSIGSSISADGRYVAFGSGAANLVMGDTNETFDVFVHTMEDECPDNQGHFVFPNGTPIKGAHIYAYYFDNGILQRINNEADIVTADDGTYTRPQAFCLRDQGQEPYVSMQLGVLAEIRYEDPGLRAAADAKGETYNGEAIVNYPSNDPFAPLSKELSGAETIVVPYPTILHAGLKGTVGSLAVLGRYLRCDPGSACDDFPAAYRKAPRRIPAFLTFTMASRYAWPYPNDGVNWGYDNTYPLDVTQHNGNIATLDVFIKGQVRSTLQSLVTDAISRNALPINICAHSMGGTITRGWMHDHTSPSVARYVSFDGVHGGTDYWAYSSGGKVKGFAEWSMNGTNLIANEPPRPLGWNYLHSIDSDRNLLMSSSNDSTVNPNCSAFGVGRTMNSFDQLKPNDHRGRFIRGWELHTDYDHSAIHDSADTVFYAAEFLANGDPPLAAKRSAPASECVNDPAVANVADDGPPGIYSVRISADSMQLNNQSVFVDSNDTVTVSVILEGMGTSFELLGPSGQSLIPNGVESSDSDGVAALKYTYNQMPVGQSTLRLDAGSDGASAEILMEFSNQRKLAVVLPGQSVESGNSIPILALLRDSADQMIVGTDGIMNVSIERPDSTIVDLALYDDGLHGDEATNDGIYGNVFADTAPGGRYVATAHAVVEFQSETIERTAFGMFVVNSSPASLVGISNERSVDQDANGKIDFLDIDVNVAVVEPKRYLLSVVLLDGEGEQIAEVHQVFDGVAAASQTVTLSLAATDIVAHGTPGPWTLGSIQLFDDEQVLMVDTLPDYQTGVYDLISFETPPPPTLLRAVPDHGSLYGGSEIILQGQHFEHVSALSWRGQSIPNFEILDDSAIRIMTPPSSSCPQSTVDVQLTTPWGNAAADVYNYSVMRGDFDVNGKIDLGDYGAFRTCAGASDAIPNPPSPSCTDACRIAFDFDSDGDVDLMDFGVFQNLLGQ